MIWDSPEERHRKKIRKAGKGAATALGGGVALWVFSMIYPKHDEAEPIAALLGDLSVALMLYGIAILACILFKEKVALKFNALLTWLALPSYVAYLFMNAAQ